MSSKDAPSRNRAPAGMLKPDELFKSCSADSHGIVVKTGQTGDEKIDQDQDLGTTTEERRGALAAAKRICVAVCVVDGGAAAAFVWGPAEYRLAALIIVALAPAAAAYMVHRQPLLYGVLKPKGDPRADVTLILTISGFGMLMSATNVNFISRGLLFPSIVIGALAFLAMFYQGVRKNPRFGGMLAGLVFLSALYGWGLAASVDTAADASVPQTYTARVLGRHVSHGSRSISYYLELEPWGPYAAVGPQMKVSQRLYHATRPGQLVCLALHSGTLHAPWYEAVSCDSLTP